MARLKTYTARILKQYVSTRAGEKKLGQAIGFLEKGMKLSDSKAKFVLLGIPEDIGVRANYGKAGTSKAWESALAAFLNLQENQFISGSDLLLLGEIDCFEELEKASNLDLSDPNYYAKMGELVSTIDSQVSLVVQEIVAAGKLPIIIGGGHNNAYGAIKGTSKALNQPINVLNIDAHTDLRALEHRHSGNGFSYALKDGYLQNYGVFGLHQNYTPQYIYDQINSSENIKMVLFEELTQMNRITAFFEMLDELSTKPFGLEVDCDAIANFPSSAQSPAGFTLSAVEEMLHAVGQKQQCKYVHICEAIPENSYPTGKALSYMISGFVKAYSSSKG